MGCFKSKSIRNISIDTSTGLSTVVSAPTISQHIPRRLTPQELQDVTYIMETLRTENIDLYVISCMFDRVFVKHPEIKKMFINSAFLDPYHTMNCATDPWFQGFLKAYVNAIVKYISLQEDQAALTLFVADLRDMHVRVKGIETKHVEYMMQCLFTEVVKSMGKHMDSRQRCSWKNLMMLLGNTGLNFLPIGMKQPRSSVI